MIGTENFENIQDAEFQMIAPESTLRTHRRVKPGNRDCAVCLCEHNDQIHTATLSVRQWFRSEVTKYLD